MSFPSSTDTSVRAAPVAAAERIQALDVLRGFALFGVVVVNGTFGSGADELPNPDPVADWVLWNMIEGRFYTLFAFLFGLGFALQLGRSETRGVALAPMYVRRLLVLFGIGFLHVLLAYSGDILMSYALMGLLLLPLSRLSTRGLFGAIVLILLLPSMIRMGLYPALDLRPPTPLDSALVGRVIADGSFAEVAALRVDQWTYRLTRGWWSVLPNNLALFTLGLIVGRSGLLHVLSERESLVRKVLFWGLAGVVAGFGAKALLGAVYPVPPPGGSFWHLTWSRFADKIALWPQTVVYASALLLLYHRLGWAERLAPLAAAGRMALSNYLLASVVFSLLFNGYGLGLHGQLSLPLALLLMTAFYAVEARLSQWWLARFRFGPAEWAWRSLTYGELQPMRMAKQVPAAVGA